MGTFLLWLALIIGIGAFAYSWRLQQELTRATRRLDRYNRALFDANDEIRQLREELADTVAELRVEAMQQGSSNLTFTAQMTVNEALQAHPQTEAILAGFHLGGCSSCAVDPSETLAQACREQGRDLTQLLQNLNLLLTTPSGATSDPRLTPVKIPNVEFSVEL